MELIRVSVAFHERSRVPEIIRGKESWRTVFGHVSAYGYTRDDTWLFFDPKAEGTSIRICHRHDEVLDQLAAVRATARRILSIEPLRSALRVPWHPTMNCASQCAALLGLRAYTPWGLERMLLAKGASIIHESENPQRGSGR